MASHGVLLRFVDGLFNGPINGLGFGCRVLLVLS